MKDVIVAIRVGSAKSALKLVQGTFCSIRENIGTPNFLVLVSLGPMAPGDTRGFVTTFCKDNANFRVFQDGEFFWSDFINAAVREALVCGCRYFVKSHDDIELESKDFFQRLEVEVDRLKENIGWISFTDTGWRRGDLSPAVREGYHYDTRYEQAFQSGRIFQFHHFPSNWVKAKFVSHSVSLMLRKFAPVLGFDAPNYPKPIKKISSYQLDCPCRPVRAHAPYNHFVAVKLDALRKIGFCENWGTKNSLYVDEDWGLRASLLGFVNIWIPGIEYFHYRGEGCGGSTRSLDQIRSDGNRVEKEFRKKWGFNPDPTEAEVELISKRYRGTMIAWSIGRRTYDWDYAL